MFKLILYLACIVLLLNYRSDQSEFAQNRLIFAKEADQLAECKIFSQDEQFYPKQEICRVFNDKDNDCKTFSDQKPECALFLAASNYAENKYNCSMMQKKSDDCDTLVKGKLWYGWALNYRENTFFKAIFNLLGIDAYTTWSELIKSFDLKINVAIVAPGDTKKEFFQGVDLAVEDINSDGGVLGRSLAVIKYDKHVTVDGSKEIAEDIIKNSSIMAVISAQTSEKTKPVTKIYERGAVFNIITSATNMDIINADMRFTFRMIPNNASMADKTVEFLKKRNYKKIAIVSERSAYAEELSNSIYNAAVERHITVSYLKNFFPAKKDFADIITELSEKKIDVIYFSGRYRSASKFLIQFRNMGITTPVIGTESLDAENFISLAGTAGEGTIIPSVYNEKLISPEHSKFSDAYKKKYGSNPNAVAVQGYDAVKLLVMGMNEMKTTIPEEVAAIGHFEKDWYGAGGKFKFNKENGVEKEIFFKVLHLGQYEIIDE